MYDVSSSPLEKRRYKPHHPIKTPPLLVPLMPLTQLSSPSLWDSIDNAENGEINVDTTEVREGSSWEGDCWGEDIVYYWLNCYYRRYSRIHCTDLSMTFFLTEFHPHLPPPAPTWPHLAPPEWRTLWCIDYFSSWYGACKLRTWIATGLGALHALSAVIVVMRD